MDQSDGIALGTMWRNLRDSAAKEQVCVTLISRDPKLRLDQALQRFPELQAKLAGAELGSSEKGALSAACRLKRVVVEMLRSSETRRGQSMRSRVRAGPGFQSGDGASRMLKSGDLRRYELTSTVCLAAVAHGSIDAASGQASASARVVPRGVRKTSTHFSAFAEIACWSSFTVASCTDGLTLGWGCDRLMNLMRHFQRNLWLPLLAMLLALVLRLPAAAQDAAYRVDPAQSSVKFTLGDVLHTVRGTFKLKQGDMQIAADGKVSGQIVVDAGSGDSGSGMRDRKMNKEVLESARFPEIAFRPDRIDGAVASSGKSSVSIHGMFNIHGVDRDIIVPAQVETSGEQWTATVHFTVPYQKWGMKNPSTLFLRVNDTVEIDLLASGTVVRHTAHSAQ